MLEAPLTPLGDWLDTELGQYVQSYIDYGFYVFPCHGVTKELRCTCGKSPCGENNKQAGKHPFTAHGSKDASNNIAHVAEMFNYRTDLNIAVATGYPSMVFVVDTDSRDGKSGEDSFRDLRDEKGFTLPPTLSSVTGTGLHRFYKLPDFEVKNATGILPLVDIRGKSGYVIVAPSRHYTGNIYSFETACETVSEAPEWLVDMMRPKKREKVAHAPISHDSSSGALPEWSVDDVYSMLSFLSADMEYAAWVEVGMSLHAGGYSLSVWDDWSRGGSKYQNGDCELRWKGFNPSSGITMGSLVQMAQLQGWKPAPYERPAVDTSNIEVFVDKMRKKAKGAPILPEDEPLILPEPAIQIEAAAFKFGFDPLALPGLIGDTIRAITKYALQPQPELALLNTLCAAGAIFGRRYASPMNTRTNLYMVGIARTAGGKDHSRTYIANITQKAGLMEYMGANYIRSDTGMLVGLMAKPSQIMMIDEFGMYLEAVTNPKAPTHFRNISAVLTKLYTSSGSFYDHGQTADTRQTPIVIQVPNLCIYGTTTEQNYVKALKREAVESGELNRFLVFKSDRKFTGDEQDPPDREIPDDLVEAWARFSPINSGGLGAIANLTGLPPEPIVVAWDAECIAIQKECYRRQQDMINSGAQNASLWGRYRESIIKIAMIFAIARNKGYPEFTKADFDIAINIVDTCLAYMSNLASNNMAETEHESAYIEILNYITMFNGAGVSKTVLFRRFRKHKRRDMEDLISAMIDQDVVSAEKDTGSKGKPSVLYKAT